MSIQKYEPSLVEGRRVLFKGRENNARNGQRCTILGALPNPSRRSEHQWYDVRFDDYTAGRYLEKFLHVEESNEEKNRVA